MKLLKALLATSTLGTISLPTTLSIISNQTLHSLDKHNLELLELSSFENLFNNVIAWSKIILFEIRIRCNLAIGKMAALKIFKIYFMPLFQEFTKSILIIKSVL
ncbi:hypothetical protein JN01_0278 [Entomoplasma freundtii]|uniref:Uncharacterized protein n=1 Tax=Entomoplasma freundtii TaxID=74700 RepID=A0A2K8NT08_9MOLU|nr:hypothetical protein EFREU_v1c02820 [Entomoplasma freundtii]TDY56790.1 hypothetical protein JN01_0278 [Entomoplasma freundtii]